MRKLYWLVPCLMMLLGLGFVFYRGLQQDPHVLQSTMIGKPLPAFELPGLHTKMLSNRQFHGKVSLLHVWASWCQICKVEHPFLFDIKEHNFPIYGVVYKDSKEQIAAWLKRYGNPYQALGFDFKGDLAIELGAYGTPETYLIDKQGMVRYRHVGAITEHAWKTELLPELMKLRRGEL